MAYAFMDALGDNTIYCIQVYDTSKVTQTEDMIYKTTNLSYDATVTVDVAKEIGYMLNAFRVYCGKSTFYLYDDLAQCAQTYCNSVTASKINARNSDELLNAMLDCNVDPMTYGESCYYDAADAVSFANSMIELDAFYTALLKDSGTYRYIGVGMAAKGSHTYLAVDYIDEY